jgi:uncharacterized protein (DUF1330 family)
MSYQMWIGLNVTDSEGYASYRRDMRPMFERHGGKFLQDFLVSKTLVSSASHPVNRVFLIEFPTRESKERFLSDPEYLLVKRKYYIPSVSGTSYLAEFEAR